ncbi:uncharacterized protein LOC144103991 isoform X1 [Amblyomma americanum]
MLSLVPINFIMRCIKERPAGYHLSLCSFLCWRQRMCLSKLHRGSLGELLCGFNASLMGPCITTHQDNHCKGRRSSGWGSDGAAKVLPSQVLLGRSFGLQRTRTGAFATKDVSGKGLSGAGRRCGSLREQKLQTRWRRFLCPECDYATDFNTSFKNHQRKHSGERPFQCSHCGKSFTLKGHLTDHLRIHTGERPYHCNHCDKSFIQISGLRQHLHRHRDGKEYRCHLCPMTFVTKSSLGHHMQSHRSRTRSKCLLLQ